ncbi:hypothetical protein MUK42_21006 [Musa troglodytarum]|uniref:Uncharacterized protein n=1 Tax=Musa troglodytarum TaxID=320322 RepID=A0A9E7ER29_9LILI|nr:hypothetical protein MUK42_21006 [Musa troglodytarum]
MEGIRLLSTVLSPPGSKDAIRRRETKRRREELNEVEKKRKQRISSRETEEESQRSLRFSELHEPSLGRASPRIRILKNLPHDLHMMVWLSTHLYIIMELKSSAACWIVKERNDYYSLVPQDSEPGWEQ